jgi:hypothetical protein
MRLKILFQYIRNLIGVVFTLTGVYLTVMSNSGYIQTWGTVIFTIGIFMFKEIIKNEK